MEFLLVPHRKIQYFHQKMGLSPRLQPCLFSTKLELTGMLRHFQRQGGYRNGKNHVCGAMLGDSFVSDSGSKLGRVHDDLSFQQLFLGRDEYGCALCWSITGRPF